MADADQREDEFEALVAIFGENIVNVSRDESGLSTVPARPKRALRTRLSSWPRACGGAGEVVLYNWVEWLREQELLWSAPAGPTAAGATPRGGGGAGVDEGGEGGGGSTSRRAAAVKEAAREQEVLELLQALRVSSGQAHVEKKSTFQAHVAPVASFDEVRAVMDALLSIGKIRVATHNIMAYRIHVPAAGGGAGSFTQDYDDDGETAAGGRLLHLLQAADVRNVVVVVSRWYGGVKMGPARFTVINNTARVQLERMGLAGGAGSKGGGGGPRGGKVDGVGASKKPGR
ncbi:Protein IMPACT-B [Tetrabaena socialis]|uniref:Protein IMPACT-B n=1 Tax=Tetrabaena socialis TaxID=47790 RepID=A0A2J8AC72_9CHLO|nr:Protein IMPACT-B [Tetrabaena socialis]|eukprot:PNH10122.1 Protein IMPACT-B [Tetrabaena socialis]